MRISTTTVLTRGCQIGCAAVLLLGLTYLSGCGGTAAGPVRFQVSGNVTCAGKAVPAGSIMFEPDKSKGNSGPASFAKIKDGKYDTQTDGEGCVGGPHVVRITALDGAAQPDSPDGVLLCPEYSTSVDLPKEKTTKDFDIPQGGSGEAKPKPNKY